MFDVNRAHQTPLQILLALSENGTKGYQHTFANQQLVQRLRDMATDVSLSQVPFRIRHLALIPCASLLIVTHRPKSQAQTDRRVLFLVQGLRCESVREVTWRRALTRICFV